MSHYYISILQGALLTVAVSLASLLAGFVDAGESAEQAVHREIFEETALAIRDVRYFASQPWPFPHSLMLGFQAQWAGGEIVCDPREIEDAAARDGWPAQHAALARLDLPLISHAGEEKAVHGAGQAAWGNPLRLRRALDHGVRVIVGEMSRMTDHLTCIGASAMELGAFTPRSIMYAAPPFRHTHFAGRQVVVHDRTETLHEIFAYNLYPGPSAKKGVFSLLLDIGEREGWTTNHCSAVGVLTPYDNQLIIMHEIGRAHV